MSRLIIYKIDHEEALRFLKFPLETEDNLSLEIKEKIRFKKDRIFSKKIVNKEINPESDINREYELFSIQGICLCI